MNRQQLQTVAVFALLVAIAVVGRNSRLDWGFTPIAAAALFAGRFFTSRLIAVSVPALSLLLSNLVEPSHTHTGVALVVLASMMLPALLGVWLRHESQSQMKNMARWAVCLLAPSALFFVTTNFAVWAFQAYYEKSVAGLLQCYAAGVPFYRSMLAGDLFYAAALFGAAALAGVAWPRVASQPVATGHTR